MHYATILHITGFDYICKAIESFEDSLETRDNDKIIKSVTQLARSAGYSVHHFTRLFYVVTGLHPKEYISGRILSEAAREIVKTNQPLNSIARSIGYPEYETFTRAFKKRFGFSPRQVRESLCLPSGCLARLVPKIKVGNINLASREPEILEMESYCITGLPFYAEEGTKSLHKQWAVFMGAQSLI
jgi:AraC family transcriptional regulator